MPDVITPTCSPPRPATGPPRAAARRRPGRRRPGGARPGLPVGEGGWPRGAGGGGDRPLGLDAASVGAAHEPSSEPGKVTPCRWCPGSTGPAACSWSAGGAGAGGPAPGRRRPRPGGPGPPAPCHHDRRRGLSRCRGGLVEGCALGGYTPPGGAPRRASRLRAGRAGDAGGRSRMQLRCATRPRARRGDAGPQPERDAVEPQEPRLDGRAGQCPRPYRRPEGAGVDRRRAAHGGFRRLLAVGGGSATPPRLVQVDYEPPKATGRRRAWCSSARASPSTPAGSTSSPPRACSR